MSLTSHALKRGASPQQPDFCSVEPQEPTPSSNEECAKNSLPASSCGNEKARLRVAMLLDRRSVPQWNYSLAMEIKRSLVLELVPVFLHGVHANDRHQRRSSSNGGSLLFRLWNKLDRRLCNPDIDVLQLREFDNSLNPAESLEISVSNNGARPYLPESELGK